MKECNSSGVVNGVYELDHQVVLLLYNLIIIKLCDFHLFSISNTVLL